MDDMQKYNEVYRKLKPSEKAMEQLKEIPERNGKKRVKRWQTAVAALMVLILVGGGASYATAKIWNEPVIYLIEQEIEVAEYTIYVDYLKVTPKEYTLYVKESEDLKALLQLDAIVNLDEKKDVVRDENGNIIFEGFFNKRDDETFRRVWEEGHAVYDMLYEIYLYTDCGDIDLRELCYPESGKLMGIGLGEGKASGEGGPIEDGYWHFTYYFSRTRDDIDQIDYLFFAGQYIDLSDCKIIR